LILVREDGSLFVRCQHVEASRICSARWALVCSRWKDESSNQLSSVEKYNPLTDEWTEVAAMKEKRFIVKLVVANEKLYAVGGHGTSDQDSVEVFDPEDK
ncbi:kelch repeat protein, partial [Cooperia oncophora]